MTDKPDSLSSCRCEACVVGRPHNLKVDFGIQYNWTTGRYKIFQPYTFLEEYDDYGNNTSFIAELSDTSGLMFIAFLESIRPGMVAALRATPMAPSLHGQWPADDYDGVYAEYYYQRFHRFPLEAPAAKAADELLKELGL